DLTFDLGRERRRALLMEYLRPGYRQGISKAQERIDSLLRSEIDQEFSRGRSGSPERTFSRFFKLWALRQTFGLYIGQADAEKSRSDVPLFREILKEARLATRGWGGDLYFVYLP